MPQGIIFCSIESKGIYTLGGKADNSPGVRIEKEIIEEKLTEINPWDSNGKKRRWSCVSLYMYESRLYIEVDLTWKEKETEKTWEDFPEYFKRADTYKCYGAVMLSADMDEITNLTYEKELSEAFRNMKESHC